MTLAYPTSITFESCDVEADAEAGEKDRERREQPDRPHRWSRPRRAARRDPDHAREQVDHRRVGQRNAREDVSLVEEPQRHREGEQDEQVEVAGGAQTAEVEKAGEEEGAEAEPDDRALDLPAAEGAGVAARHLPGDLRARPRLRDHSGVVVDPPGGDLTGDAVPDVHLPVLALLVVLGVGRPVRLGVAPDPVGDLGVLQEGRGRAGLRQLGSVLDRGERSLDEPPLRVVRGPGRRGRCSRSRGRERRQREQQQGESGTPHPSTPQRRRNDQSLLPTKLIGMTSTTAIAWAAILPIPSATNAVRNTSFAARATSATTRKRRPWYAM